MTEPGRGRIRPSHDGIAGRGAGQETRGVQRILRPFHEFVRFEASSGILLIAAALLALIWANSPWADQYFRLWQSRLTVGLTDFSLTKPLLSWVNDALMALFFLVVGLEIKREIRGGELADPRKAALPVAAALGGMVAPAALYLAFNAGSEGARGWGVPTATDIAFALGVLALVGRHAPVALKVFLTALAIVDDIGAVVVIAVFYTSELAWSALAVGGGVLAALSLANRAGVRSLIVYAPLGVVLWLAFLQSGIHATVAGVLLAMTIPSQAGGTSPIYRLEHGLHPWVTYAVLPLFALANAGVAMNASGLVGSLSHPVGLGVLIGLLVGKQVGITLATWLAVQCGLATLPNGVGWRHIYGVGWLGGIGFTMSIFIAGLAFGGTPLLDTAKVAIFAASLGSGFAGWLVVRSAGVGGSEPVVAEPALIGRSAARPVREA